VSEQAEHKMDDFNEDEDLYGALVAVAAAVCRDIFADPPVAGLPLAARIWSAAREFVEHTDAHPLPPGPASDENENYAVFLAFAKLRADWPELRAGRLTGEDAYAATDRLWDKLMFEPPMGRYAALAALFINRRIAPGQLLVELGAGVGMTSRLLTLPDDVTYFRTDINPFLLRRPNLPGTPRRYDFDEPSTLRGADLVFAVNALHCARDQVRTLSHVREMLRDDGLLLFAEGNARTNRAGLPSVMDVIFSQFTGWWDRSGFRPREEWLADLHSAGFRSVGYQRFRAGEHDLGGLIWARR
jgi:SAM-dependent methyltransferase